MALLSSWFTTSNLIRLLVVVTSCGASEIFQLPPLCPVLSDDGDALCAMDPPSLSFRFVTKLECSLKCISDRRICSAFEHSTTCRLFMNPQLLESTGQYNEEPIVQYTVLCHASGMPIFSIYESDVTSCHVMSCIRCVNVLNIDIKRHSMHVMSRHVCQCF